MCSRRQASGLTKGLVSWVDRETRRDGLPSGKRRFPARGFFIVRHTLVTPVGLQISTPRNECGINIHFLRPHGETYAIEQV